MQIALKLKRNDHDIERTHVPRRPCFGDDDHNDATNIQNTYRRPPF